MKVKGPQEVAAEEVRIEGARGVRRWVLVGEKDGAPNFALRRFRLEPEGHTPYHQHPWEHEIFVIAGQGRLRGEGGELELVPGCSAYIPAGERHQFHASAQATLEFLCIVPRDEAEAAAKAAKAAASAGQVKPAAADDSPCAG